MKKIEPTDTSTDVCPTCHRKTEFIDGKCQLCRAPLYASTPDQPQADEPSESLKKFQVADELEQLLIEATAVYQKGLPFPIVIDPRPFRKLIAQAKIEVLEQLKEIQAEAWDDATHCTCLPFAIEEIEATIKGE